MKSIKQLLLESSISVNLADPKNGGYKKLSGVYLRAGDLPKGNSGNGITGKNEKGISVYTAWKDPKTKKYVIATGSDQMITGLMSMISTRPVYEVTGKDSGNSGADGEDLLIPNTIKIIKKISLNDIVTDQDPNVTLSGKELSDKETPIWY